MLVNRTTSENGRLKDTYRIENGCGSFHKSLHSGTIIENTNYQKTKGVLHRDNCLVSSSTEKTERILRVEETVPTKTKLFIPSDPRHTLPE